MNSETDLLMPIKIQAYEHQKRAFEFIMDQFGIFSGIKKSPGVALLMEMGTGKTVTSIAAAGCMYQFGKIDKALIVCPLSITGVWESEFEKFAAFPYSLCVLRGSLNNKKEQIETLRNHGLKVIVVNYENTWRLEEELNTFRPDLIIADEGHKIKDGTKLQSTVMHRFGAKASYRLLLTGTIITNKEIDVYSQYKFLNPKVFGNSFLAFRNRYFEMLGYGGYIPVFRRYLSADFLRKLHSIAFRVTKEECLELPAIMEEERILYLTPKARSIYRKIERESYADLDKGKVSTLNILTKTLRLSQLTGGHLTDDKGTVITVDDTKLKATEEVIDMVLEENKKLVIMARFVPEISDIEALLKEKGIKYSIIRGGVKDRDEEIKRFQEDPECKIFIGQIASAGLGITLTAASIMLFYSLDYSMSNFEQAKARIHRAGQKQTCTYIYLICADTIDIKILKALRNKNDLAKMLVDDYRNGLNPFG